MSKNIFAILLLFLVNPIFAPGSEQQPPLQNAARLAVAAPAAPARSEEIPTSEKALIASRTLNEFSKKFEGFAISFHGFTNLLSTRDKTILEQHRSNMVDQSDLFIDCIEELLCSIRGSSYLQSLLAINEQSLDSVPMDRSTIEDFFSDGKSYNLESFDLYKQLSGLLELIKNVNEINKKSVRVYNTRKGPMVIVNDPKQDINECVESLQDHIITSIRICYKLYRLCEKAVEIYLSANSLDHDSISPFSLFNAGIFYERAIQFIRPLFSEDNQLEISNVGKVVKHISSNLYKLRRAFAEKGLLNPLGRRGAVADITNHPNFERLIIKSALEKGNKPVHDFFLNKSRVDDKSDIMQGNLPPDWKEVLLSIAVESGLNIDIDILDINMEVD